MITTNGHSKVRLGVIGLGGRGRGLLETLLGMDDVEIPALCDHHDDRLQMSVDLAVKAGKTRPAIYKDHNELLARQDIEGVIIPSCWTSHTEIAIAAMRAGKYAAPEVAGATSLEECWRLVRASEETGMPCMMLENVCYGRTELALMKIIKQGLFGELIHVQAGYEHDLREQLAEGIDNGHFRVHHHIHRDGDIYPTHGVGPLSKFLGINRGNRFMTLTSMSSKARGLQEWVAENKGSDHPLAKTHFTQGDVVTTMIKCAHGETILLTHDTTLPRPYSRAGRVQGTRGLWMEDNDAIHLEGKTMAHAWEPFNRYREEYEHPLWQEFMQMGVRGGHDGMDYLCLRAFADSVRHRTQTPIDVYDSAAWMAITVLSEESIAQGSNAVSFPDFTNGKWINRAPGPISKYALDDIHESLF